ncbi:glycosyltransferase [Leuconostoc mesenteroides]|uniref:glycosyltransferase n=1 Tax=Leuconostoc mesenteroides TaxID=1245 RepID=UPI000C9993FA|nr:glycosyltransferase [Leuconostoc mesenteroides]PND40676.1 hypothetical protein B0W51_09520 [Leuconostoc mesenteroides]
MKILFIGMTRNIGGTETFIMNTARTLWKNKNITTYFLNIEESKIAYEDEIIANGGRIINYSIHKGLSGLLYNKKEANIFFKDNHFDIVHINANILRTSFWAEPAKKRGVSQVFFHAHNSSYGPRNFLKRTIYSLIGYLDRRNLVKNNVKLLAASFGAGKWMFHEHPFRIVNNGVDTSLFKFDYVKREKMRKSLHINDKTFVLISVARFSYQKNHNKIIDIFNELLKTNPDSTLLLVGSGELLDQVKEKTKKLRISKHVIFMGKRDDISALLSMSDAMIFPSRYEGTPYSLIESESSGLPAMVSSEAFDQSSNITGDLKYLSIDASDIRWAKGLLDFDFSDQLGVRRLEKNKLVEKSNYSLKYFQSQIKKIYNLDNSK